MCTYVYVCVYTCLSIFLSLSISLSIYIHILYYIYIYIHMHLHTNTSQVHAYVRHPDSSSDVAVFAVSSIIMYDTTNTLYILHTNDNSNNSIYIYIQRIIVYIILVMWHNAWRLLPVTVRLRVKTALRYTMLRRGVPYCCVTLRGLCRAIRPRRIASCGAIAPRCAFGQLCHCPIDVLCCVAQEEVPCRVARRDMTWHALTRCGFACQRGAASPWAPPAPAPDPAMYNNSYLYW